MADENLAIRFARTIWDLLVPPPFVPDFDEHPDPLIARLEWAIACLPEQTREVFLMHRFDDLPYDRIAHRLGRPNRMAEKNGRFIEVGGDQGGEGEQTIAHAFLRFPG